MPSIGERVIKDSRKDSRPGGADLTDRFSCIFHYLFFHADYDHEDFYKQSGYDCCRQRILEGDLIFLYVYGLLTDFHECPPKCRKNNAAFCYITLYHFVSMYFVMPPFIFGLFGLPKLGVTGVALGTVIARIAEGIDLSYLLIKQLRCQIPNKIFCAKSRYSVQGLYENCFSGCDK